MDIGGENPRHELFSGFNRGWIGIFKGSKHGSCCPKPCIAYNKITDDTHPEEKEFPLPCAASANKYQKPCAS